MSTEAKAPVEDVEAWARLLDEGKVTKWADQQHIAATLRELSRKLEEANRRLVIVQAAAQAGYARADEEEFPALRDVLRLWKHTAEWALRAERAEAALEEARRETARTSNEWARLMGVPELTAALQRAPRPHSSVPSERYQALYSEWWHGERRRALGRVSATEPPTPERTP